jgi:uncharacterized membrane protein YphA (DoxX/SURF4 family)
MSTTEKQMAGERAGGDGAMRAAGMFFVRALLGLILFMQGLGKIVSFTVPVVYDKFFRPFEATWLPKWLIWATAYYTSYIELIGGALLVIGLFRRVTYYLVALDLLVVSFGHGMLEPIWDLGHVMPRALLLIVLFFLPQDSDRWSADNLLKINF